MMLLVLLWKLAISRCKRYFQTLFELFSCICIFFLIFQLGKLLRGIPSGRTSVVVNTEVLNFSTIDHPSKVIYYPHNNVTERLMQLVSASLQLKKLDSYSDRAKLFYYGTNDLSEIEEYSEKFDLHAAFVSFQNVHDTLPEKLTYTIKMKPEYRIYTFDADETFLSHSALGHIYEPFMSLQWAINSAFMELRNGYSFGRELSFREFPAVEDVNTMDLALIPIHQTFNLLVLSLFFMFHVGRVVEDRISGVQALLTMSGVSSFLLNLSHFLNALAAGIVYSIIGIIFYSINTPSLIENSNGFLVWLMFILYFCSIILFGFLTAFILPNKRLVIATAFFVYYGTVIIMEIIRPSLDRTNSVFFFLASLLPNMPASYFWTQLVLWENDGAGITFKTLFQRKFSNMTPFYPLLMMFLQCILYGALSYYLSLVRPGKYVAAMPWNFLCMKEFWKKRVTPDVEMSEVESVPLQRRQQYFEREPPRSQLGIQIQDVTKIYGNNNRVLKNLNLNIYKGEITVLLGHNGAGKTTILSIISGMLKPTSGKVLINGLDTRLHGNKMFSSIGVCPQENMFFNDLSVLQHIMFFTMLRKNVGFRKAKQSAMEVLKELSLDPYKNRRVFQLSGGQIRRVQLGCALAGDANLLILDEPTSGLDVETRRDLWDLLLSLRGSRTTLLTTHFMEEADVLGDRVAALHQGELRCFATTDYLKKAVGDGYLLTLITLGLPKTEDIKDVVLSEVPEATVKESSLNSIIFSLPADTTSKYPRMFQKLEENREQLSIESIGIGTATLEEVFVALCSDVDVTFNQDTVDAATQDVTYEKLTGLKLMFSQIFALLKRRIKYIMARKFSFLSLEVILPILFVAFFVYNSRKNTDPSNAKSLSMDLDIYKPLRHRKVLLDIEDNELKSLIPKLTDMYKGVEFVQADDIANETLGISMYNRDEYKKYLLGLELNDTNAQVLFSTSYRHTGPVAVNLLSNLLAGEPGTIVTYNEPIKLTKNTIKTPQKVKSNEAVLDLMVMLSIIVCVLLIAHSIPLTRERTSGTRHIFIMYGCPPILYWMITWLFHTAMVTVVIIIPSLILIYSMELDGTFDNVQFIGALFLMLLLGTMAVLAVFYLLSIIQKENAFLIFMSIGIIIFNWILPTMLYIIKQFGSANSTIKMLKTLLTIMDHFVPMFTFANGLLDTGLIAVKNANCAVARKTVCETVKTIPMALRECCSTTGNMQCYLCGEGGMGKRFLLIAVQAILFMILTLLSQMGVFSALWSRLVNMKYDKSGATSDDPVAVEEINYVSNAMNLPPSNVPDAILVHGLHKRYAPMFKYVNAVRGISISVKRGECFGLVGVNGAGKTSTFHTLVGAAPITRGKILCNGVFSSSIPGKYLRQLGFCPQHHSLDDFMTGDENLATLLQLKGFTKKDIKHEVDFWINIVALQSHRHKRMSGYSGGCKRRLAAAAALMCRSTLTVLDEPTTGVDVAARRALWMALRGRRGGRALVVSSHSMEEIEALCPRVCIMVAGRVQALGSPGDLRRRYATGHSLHFNLTSDENVATDENISKLKTDIEQMFTCILKDSHKSMLHYRITQSLKHSEIFFMVEQLKEKYPNLIADYTVKEPTLEEVFLAFARQHKEETKQMNGKQQKGESRPDTANTQSSVLDL